MVKVIFICMLNGLVKLFAHLDVGQNFQKPVRSLISIPVSDMYVI